MTKRNNWGSIIIKDVKEGTIVTDNQTSVIRIFNMLYKKRKEQNYGKKDDDFNKKYEELWKEFNNKKNKLDK